MTVEDSCYVCGKEGPAINGLCADCTMREFRSPGAAFAATFGAVSEPYPETPEEVDAYLRAHGYDPEKLKRHARMIKLWLLIDETVDDDAR